MPIKMSEINGDRDNLDYRNWHDAHLVPTQQSTNPMGILFSDDSNDTSYLRINPLPVNDDLQSFSQREKHQEYVISIRQGGQEYQAKGEEHWDWLDKVVEKVWKNHRNDGQNEAEAENDNNTFIAVDDALTGGLEMRRDEMVMFDPVEEDKEEDGESHGHQGKAGLPQDQNAQSADEPPITVPVRNILTDEGIENSTPYYLEFLEEEWILILHHTGNTIDKLYKVSTILFRMAKDLKVLEPPNKSILGPDYDISRFECKKHILDELRKELGQVLIRSPELSSSGVYVCTLTPYRLYLEMMAAEMVRGIPPPA